MNEYKYLYETHFHTNSASACAKNSVEEMIDAAIAYGYTGAILTEHNWGGNTSIPGYLLWEDWVDRFAEGYRKGLAHIEKNNLDFDFFWGYEAGYEGTEFLIYGVSPEWMKAHPELKDATIEEQYQLVHEAGGMVVHAHPFREKWYIPEVRLYPEYVDAVEAINATHSNPKTHYEGGPEFDKKAIQYAREHHLPMTAGSDVHKTDMLGGGVAFKRRLTSIQDYIGAILGGEDYMLSGDGSLPQEVSPAMGSVPCHGKCFLPQEVSRGIHLEQAYHAFDEYLEAFDRENDKIKLKIIHTEGVVRCAREISRRMGLSEEDCHLAELIALLHDIGRFEQVRRYNSFERSTMDHASYGVELLFEKAPDTDVPFIRRFISEDAWDEIIRFAIAKHSLYALDEEAFREDPINEDALDHYEFDKAGHIDAALKKERMFLHAKIIRDADKLDNCRVKLEDSLQVLLGLTAEEVGKQKITDKVWETFRNKKSIISSDRVTKMDYWVSYLAYLYDMNFAETFSIIAENDYVNRIVDRIPYQNPDTKEKMEMLRKMLNQLTDSRRK